MPTSLEVQQVLTGAGRSLRVGARFDVCRYVALQDDRLPRNPTGKLLKDLLRGGGVVSCTESG